MRYAVTIRRLITIESSLTVDIVATDEYEAVDTIIERAEDGAYEIILDSREGEPYMDYEVTEVFTYAT